MIQSLVHDIFPTLSNRIYIDKEKLKACQRISYGFHARSLVLYQFYCNLELIIKKRYLSNNDQGALKVGVIGGGIDEPELELMRSLNIPVQVIYLGIEGCDITFDLNKDNQIPKYVNFFDLILCSQVLEHVFLHERAFWELSKILRRGGFLWINVPASNKVHGEPDYYVNGFSASYLENNLKMLKFKTIASGMIGTRRSYSAVHNLQLWLTVRAHAFPIIYAYSNFSFILRLYYTIRNFFKLLHLSLISPRAVYDKRFSTESFILTQKYG